MATALDFVSNSIKNYNDVVIFNKTFNAPVNTEPTIPSETVILLRNNLLKEEIKELVSAILDNDLPKIADGVADVLYVAYGAAICYGIYFDDLEMRGNFVSHVSIETDKLHLFLNGFITSAEDKDFKSMKEFLQGIAQTCYNIASHYKFSADEAFKLAHDSNMTKACSSDEEVVKTIANYLEMDQPCYPLQLNGKFIVLREADNKILKNVNYKPADFSTLFQGRLPL